MKKKPALIEVDKLIGLKVEPYRTSYSDKQCILYALGIGFSTDPLREKDFKYTNEVNQDFTSFPTLGAAVLQGKMIQILANHPSMPQFNIWLVLHAQHKLTMIKNNIEIGRQYIHQAELIDIADKGKNAFILSKCNSYVQNEKGEKQLAFVNEVSLYFKDLGGFKFKGKGLIEPAVQIPNRKPDFSLTGQTFPGQAFLYRLLADPNPLHIDPKISKTLNFDRPIIHGLASYGTIARVFVQEVLNNDETQLKTIQTRFMGHVYPGESLSINCWKQSQDKFIYEAQVKQRGTKALRGYILIKQSAKL